MADLPPPKHSSAKDKGGRLVELHWAREQRRIKAEREAKEEGERRAGEEARTWIGLNRTLEMVNQLDHREP